ncbi:MFS transporter [Prauserella flavalba]|uniref:Major facilitator superfamily (MFS) profile domain-containing protein n=1 Tax=Prauserella flavalba TaxID=1477506 RepID=A0A318LLU9_9PSEU|nr:aromatic acid/H+ symport family MFS transporter [Prauserella flavalba]PXY35443.1 hypothetical protein BA062_07880 [Prauserella flavalba]
MVARVSPGNRGFFVGLICFIAVVFDGYDLVVYGTTIPALLEYEPWGLDAAEAGMIASYALIGMLLGTLISGFATDLLGRRKLFLTAICWFSLCMLACALAPSSLLFGLFRFLAGIGLGGVLPTAIALTVEFAPPHRRNFASAIMSSGFSVGAILASVLGIVVIEEYGFRPMFAIGVLPLVLLAPVAWRWLPESVDYLVSKGRLGDAEAVARRYGIPWPPPEGARAPRLRGRAALRPLFRPPFLGVAAVFAVATLISQLFIYGLSTWLPQIMRTAGYPLGSALSFLVAMSAGAIGGAAVMSWLADRIGPRRVALGGFLIGAGSLLLLSAHPPTAVLYVAVVLAGVGGNGTAVILNGFIATWFPAVVRASALGSIMTVARFGGILGPMLGGWIMAAGVPVNWNFYVFLLPALAGALVVVLLPRTRTAPPPGEPLRQHTEEVGHA